MADRSGKKKARGLSTNKAAVDKRSHGYTCLTLRFADIEHHQLVRDAAKASKLPMNAWLIRVTLEAARRELRQIPEPAAGYEVFPRG